MSAERGFPLRLQKLACVVLHFTGFLLISQPRIDLAELVMRRRMGRIETEDLLEFRPRSREVFNFEVEPAQLIMRLNNGWIQFLRIPQRFDSLPRSSQCREHQAG